MPDSTYKGKKDEFEAGVQFSVEQVQGAMNGRRVTVWIGRQNVQ